MARMTLADMLNKYFTATGQDADDLDLIAAAKLDLNRSFWEVLDNNNFREKEKTGQFVTEIGEARYQMPDPFEALRSLSIVDPDSLQHTNLLQMDSDQYENEHQEGTDFYDTPTRYTRESCFATLFPTPDAEYNIVIKYWTVLSDLANDADITNLPKHWDEVVLYGAISRAFFDLGDPTQGSNYLALQEHYIGKKVPIEAKEEKDTRFAKIQVTDYRGNVRYKGRGGFRKN